MMIIYNDDKIYITKETLKIRIITIIKMIMIHRDEPSRMSGDITNAKLVIHSAIYGHLANRIGGALNHRGCFETGDSADSKMGIPDQRWGFQMTKLVRISPRDMGFYQHD